MKVSDPKLGCADECLRAQILGAGVNETALEMLEGHHAKLVEAGGTGLNWQALLALVLKYGPQIVAFLLQFLNPTPAPAPTKA
jgi:hypothetical protein